MNDTSLVHTRPGKPFRTDVVTIIVSPIVLDLLAPPRAGSARSSLSEMSGASGTSTGTYLHEASTLVLETMENNAKK
jgi:hypothetical protein